MFVYLEVFTLNDELSVFGPLYGRFGPSVKLTLEFGVIFLVTRNAARTSHITGRHLNVQLSCHVNRIFCVLSPTLVDTDVLLSHGIDLQTARSNTMESATQMTKGTKLLAKQFTDYTPDNQRWDTYSKSTVVPSLSQVISGRGWPLAAHSNVTRLPSVTTVLRGVARKLGASGRPPSSNSEWTLSLASVLMRYLSMLDTLHR